jgi:antitoxin VapB
MDTAKIFQTGRSQAVRLPKAYRFQSDEVWIRRTPEGVLLIPKTGQKLGDTLAAAFDEWPVDDDGSFSRPDQGELERGGDLFEAST